MKKSIMMNKRTMIVNIAIYAVIILLFSSCPVAQESKKEEKMKNKYANIELPREFISGDLTTLEAIRQRESVRDYSDRQLSLAEVSTLLFSAQGITHVHHGFSMRAAPSAGALYPLEIYLVANRIEGLDKGIYRYIPQKHSLEMIKEGNLVSDVCNAALRQDSIKKGAAVFIYSAVPQRTTVKYGNRGIRYIYIEVGHASQNVFLQATSMNIDSVVIGAFDDQRLNDILGIDGKKETAVYIQVLGKP